MQASTSCGTLTRKYVSVQWPGLCVKHNTAILRRPSPMTQPGHRMRTDGLPPRDTARQNCISAASAAQCLPCILLPPSSRGCIQ